MSLVYTDSFPFSFVVPKCSLIILKKIENKQNQKRMKPINYAITV